MTSVIVIAQARHSTENSNCENASKKIMNTLQNEGFHYVEENIGIICPIDNCKTSFFLILTPSECLRLRSVLNFSLSKEVKFLHTNSVTSLYKISSDVDRDIMRKQKEEKMRNFGTQTCEVDTTVKCVQTEETKMENKGVNTDQTQQRASATMTDSLLFFRPSTTMTDPLLFFQSSATMTDPHISQLVKEEPCDQIANQPCEQMDDDIEVIYENITPTVMEKRASVKRSHSWNYQSLRATCQKMRITTDRGDVQDKVKIEDDDEVYRTCQNSPCHPGGPSQNVRVETQPQLILRLLSAKASEARSSPFNNHSSN